MVEVTVYGKPGCVRCTWTKKKLEGMRLKYQYIDVEEDPAGRAVVEHLGYQQLPVVLVGDMHWDGHRHDKLNNLGRILNSAEWHTKSNFDSELAAIEYLRKEMGWETR